MVSLGSFDTHADQVDRQQLLLQDLSDSVKAFYEDLADAGMDDKVLSMTISEFGRRPYENGSNGTDHGAPLPLMLFGPALNGNGFIGQHPDLLNWDDHDNLIPTNDFRDVYSTILTSWFCLEPQVVDSILLNKTTTNWISDWNAKLWESTIWNPPTVQACPVYRQDGVYIEMQFETTAHGVIKLYDLTGGKLPHWPISCSSLANTPSM